MRRRFSSICCSWKPYRAVLDGWYGVGPADAQAASSPATAASASIRMRLFSNLDPSAPLCRPNRADANLNLVMQDGRDAAHLGGGKLLPRGQADGMDHRL